MNKPSNLSQQEFNAWLECGARDHDIKCIGNAGGFESISKNNSEQIRLQDMLDNLLTQRIYAVRNALRQLDWDGTHNSILRKSFDAERFSFEQKITHVGAGRNMAAVAYVIKNINWPPGHSIEIVEDMQNTAADMANYISANCAPDQLSSEANLKEVIPDSDGSYGIGFRDALESITLALLQRGVSQPDVDAAVLTAMDAYSNTELSHADSGTQKAVDLCAQMARMTTYKDTLADAGDAVETVNWLICNSRAIIKESESALLEPATLVRPE